MRLRQAAAGVSALPRARPWSLCNTTDWEICCLGEDGFCDSAVPRQARVRQREIFQGHCIRYSCRGLGLIALVGRTQAHRVCAACGVSAAPIVSFNLKTRTVRMPFRNRSSLSGFRVVRKNLVDPASSHMLVSKIKPCMSQYKLLYGETANGSLKQL